MKRSATLGIAVAAAVVGIGSVTWFNIGRQASETVRIATFSTAIDYAPYFVAKANGYFDEELGRIGMVPAYSRFESLPPLNDALQHNQLDAVFEAEPPAFIAEASGTDVSVIEVSATLTQKIIARANSGIRSMADLRGRKIGVLTGTSSHYGILRQLENAGLSPSDVELVNVAPVDARAAFESGQIDAWAVWPPFPEHEQAAGRAVEVPGSAAVIQSLLVVDGDFARSNPAAMRAIDTAVDRAKAFIVSNPEKAQELVAAATGEPIAVVRAAWSKHNFAATLDASVRADIDQKARFLFANKFIAKPVNPERDLFVKGNQ